jgi:Skp family chaperone for outer membrane proteins
VKGTVMKKTLICCLLSTAVLTVSADDKKIDEPKTAPITQPALKQVTGTDALNIRYVDPYKIIPKLEQWNDERVKIQKELENRTRQIEELKTAYTTKANELQSKGNLVTDVAKDNAIKELKRLETNIQIEQQSFQEYAERASQEAQITIFKEIESTAKAYAQANGIDFVLAGGAIYVNEKYDISDIIADTMNKKYVAQKAKTAPKAPEVKKP